MRTITKRSAEVIFCLLLVVAMIFSLHTASYATEGAGAQPDEATESCTEHSWQEKADEKYLASKADCENAARYYVSCEICGIADKDKSFSYGKPLYHLYMMEKVSEKAGLDKDGSTNFYCINCDKKDNAPIPFAGIKTVSLSQSAYSFTGREIIPDVTVTDKNGAELKQGSDYTVTCENNKAPGKAGVRVDFIGKYEGSKTLSFTINELPATDKLDCSVKTNSASLSWSKVEAATGYRVYIKTADGKYTEKTTTATSITVKELASATKYIFVVKAFSDVDGKTYVSQASKRITTATKPLGVSSLTATAGTSAVALKWSEVAGADSYNVYLYNSKTKSYELYKTVKGTSLKVKELKSAKTYAFKVAAVKMGVKGEAKLVKATTKPLAPSTVKANTSTSAVALKWSKVSGADSYNVYFYNSKTKSYELYKTVKDTSLKVKELKSATTYAFKVAAVKAGVRGEAKLVKATTKPLTPSAVTVNTSTSAADLKWSKVTGADSYKVYLYNAKTKKYALYKTVKETSLKVEGLNSATTYAFKVAAVKAGVRGEAKLVKATTKPLAPSAMTVNTSTSAADLEWSKVSGADSYNVYIRNDKTKSYELYKTVTATSLRIDGLKSATTYTFAVRAVKAKLTGSAVIARVTTKPLAPAKLISNTNTSAVALKWSKVSGADSYNVYIRNDKTKTYELYKTVTSTNLKIEGLNSGTTYTFAVRAVKAKLTGSAVIARASTKPLAVSSLTATSSASAVALKWSKVSGADSYNVYKYNAKTKNYDLYKTVTDTSLTVSGLESASTYAFAVRAVKAGGTGAAKVVSVTTKPLPVAVLNAASTEDSVTLIWEKVKGADEYRVYLYNEKTKSYELCKSVADASLTVKGLTSDTEYTFSVVTAKITADGEETLGAKKNITVKTQPGAPERPEKIAVSAEKGKATVRWTAVDGADGYQVAYKDGQTGKNVLMGEVKPGELILAKDGFKAGVEYVFGVRSYKVVDGKKVYSSFRVKTVTMK